MMLAGRIGAGMVLVLAMAGVLRAENAETVHYAGTIGGNLQVAAVLTTRESKVEGRYLYAQHGREIDLAGTADAGMGHLRVELAEKNESDKTVATFKLSVTLADVLAQPLTGTWESADGKRKLPVSLAPVAKDVTLLSAVSDRYEVRTAYPKFLKQSAFYTAVNARLSAAATQAHAARVKELSKETAEVAGVTGALPWESDEFPFVFYASGGLVSVRMQGYEFTGGAHGNHAFEARNFAWVNNALVELAAKDVIAPSHYKELRELCIKDLKSQHASWPEQIGVNKETPPILNVTAQALVVTFPPYEAGSYAEGAYTVCLPLAAVASLMPAESPVKPLAK